MIVEILRDLIADFVIENGREPDSAEAFWMKSRILRSAAMDEIGVTHSQQGAS